MAVARFGAPDRKRRLDPVDRIDGVGTTGPQRTATGLALMAAGAVLLAAGRGR
jgi:hypothetical protein